MPILANEVDNVRKYGLRPVVCMNHFYTDDDAEIKVVLDWAKSRGAYQQPSQIPCSKVDPEAKS